MTYNTDTLDKNLRAAGISFSGCNEHGVVWGPDGKTEIQTQSAVKAVLDAYDPENALWNEVRSKRNDLLTACDWTMLSDADLTEGQRAAWVTYRQALRDITDSFSSPDAVVWPEEPINS